MANSVHEGIMNALASLERGQERKRKFEDQNYDRAVKEATLREAGFNIRRDNGGFQIERDPEYVSKTALEKNKLQLENKLNQFRLDRANQGIGFNASPNLKPKSYDEFGMPKDYVDVEQELAQKRKEEELKREFELQKPLSDTASGRLAGSKQVIEQVAKLRSMTNPQNFGNMKQGVSKIKIGQKLGITDPSSIRGAVVNAASLGTAPMLVKTSDEQKQFELAVNLIAENLLRARTGAAAPTPEQIREEARQLVGDDTYESFLNRIQTSEGFARDVGEGIRPGFMGQQAAQVPSWVPQDIDYKRWIADGGTEEQLRSELKRIGRI